MIALAMFFVPSAKGSNLSDLQSSVLIDRGESDTFRWTFWREGTGAKAMPEDRASRSNCSHRKLRLSRAFRGLDPLAAAHFPNSNCVQAKGRSAEARKLIERRGWSNVQLLHQDATQLQLDHDIEGVLFSLLEKKTRLRPFSTRRSSSRYPKRE